MIRNASILIAPHALLAGAALLPPWAASASLAIWAASQAFVVTELLRPRSRLFGPGVWKGSAQPRVALTFDDGPHPVDTPAILDILSSAGARATFFFVGAFARSHPDLVRRAAREGHEIGVHSDTHPWWFSVAGPRRVRREVREAARVLGDLSERRPRFFRPPMGHKNIFLADELASAELWMATWSTRAFDTLGRPPEKILDRILRGATPGSVILLHEGVRRATGHPSPTVTALPGILEGLKRRGLEAVTLGDLQAAQGKEAKPARRSASA